MLKETFLYKYNPKRVKRTISLEEMLNDLNSVINTALSEKNYDEYTGRDLTDEEYLVFLKAWNESLNP